ncbi:hypothetical protein Peur_048348 [Populus x canadensis]
MNKLYYSHHKQLQPTTLPCTYHKGIKDLLCKSFNFRSLPLRCLCGTKILVLNCAERSGFLAFNLISEAVNFGSLDGFLIVLGIS